ncbi:HpcH/HpaI aldolase/citrate lyase family protein [Bacillus sp. T33-2]|uniref:HpcH/HpaI aldolase/citrate lyase family protein n=1 Tax=Bacillus sp. T33-2 TaxID=2054168 RepID=UPI000C761B00|nr:HpcH/HpaI aldolase/citrate lyase family protein [Bacillus sp. T33-2]PLR98738.1 citrate lyase subunit beta [Bacillus sp. T33-2]
MRHFNYLSKEKEAIFYQMPHDFSKDSEREMLANSLGAVLYMPGTRISICDEIISGKHDGLTSMVLCLEDAVSDREVERAEWNVVAQLRQLSSIIDDGLFAYEQLPLIFIRVRSADQMDMISGQLGSSMNVITGFVFPKFSSNNGVGFLDRLNEINGKNGPNLYGMPILETPEIIYKESRMNELLGIKQLLDENYGNILNVRMGATDFCGLFGIRRSSDSTIYDITVIRDCIADIVNVFARSQKEYTVSGPVWEYFNKGERVFKPQLRQTPFQSSMGQEGLSIRKGMLNQNLDGLIKEVIMDKNNGLTGKTIIHPTHIKPVHAFSVVTFEEYMDAVSIVENANGEAGVMKSMHANKMNEVKPHYNWAKKILAKAKSYGVFHDQNSYIDLLTETEAVYV